jgi:hypothetical protein
MQDDIKQWFEELDAYEALHGRPYLEAANQNDKDAVDVAKLLIQSLLLLHGGALIAIPTFASLREGMPKDTLIALLVCFSSGLIAALLAGMSAFFALVERSEYYSKLREATDYRAAARAAGVRFLNTQNPTFENCQRESDKAATEIEKHASPLFERYLKLRSLGIFLVCLSILGLVAASFIAVNAL